MRQFELIVPLLVSFGFMLLMVRSWTHARLAVLPARANSRGPYMADSFSGSGASMMVSHETQFSYIQNKSDMERAMHVVEQVQETLHRFEDYRSAVADGYKFNASETSDSLVCLTNYWFGFKSGFDFDTAHPTSLFYRVTPEGEYKISGAMLTAPERCTEQQLDERIPINIAQWKKHPTLGWAAIVFPFEPDSRNVWKRIGPKESAA